MTEKHYQSSSEQQIKEPRFKAGIVTINNSFYIAWTMTYDIKNAGGANSIKMVSKSFKNVLKFMNTKMAATYRTAYIHIQVTSH